MEEQVALNILAQAGLTKVAAEPGCSEHDGTDHMLVEEAGHKVVVMLGQVDHKAVVAHSLVKEVARSLVEEVARSLVEEVARSLVEEVAHSLVVEADCIVVVVAVEVRPDKRLCSDLCWCSQMQKMKQQLMMKLRH